MWGVFSSKKNQLTINQCHLDGAMTYKSDLELKVSICNKVKEIRAGIKLNLILVVHLKYISLSLWTMKAETKTLL